MRLPEPVSRFEQPRLMVTLMLADALCWGFAVVMLVQYNV